MRSIGVTRVCGQLAKLCKREARLAGLGDPLVPERLALRLQGQRLHRLDADNGLAERRRFPGLGVGHAGCNSTRSGLRKARMISVITAAQASTIQAKMALR